MSKYACYDCGKETNPQEGTVLYVKEQRVLVCPSCMKQREKEKEADNEKQ